MVLWIYLGGTRVVAFLRQKRNEWFTFATHMRACRVGRLLHAPGLLSTSQLSNPSTQWVAPRAGIA